MTFRETSLIKIVMPYSNYKLRFRIMFVQFSCYFRPRRQYSLQYEEFIILCCYSDYIGCESHCKFKNWRNWQLKQHKQKLFSSTQGWIWWMWWMSNINWCFLWSFNWSLWGKVPTGHLGVWSVWCLTCSIRQGPKTVQRGKCVLYFVCSIC